MQDLAIRLVLAALATWRLSAFLYFEDGPWDLGFRIRERAGVHIVDENGDPEGFYGKTLTCFWCLTFWVSIPVLVVAWLVPWLLGPFALSGAAMLLSGGGRVIWRNMVDGH